MKRLIYILFLLSAVALTDASAQVDKREVRRGNRDFRKENYREAEVDYLKAIVKDSMSVAANYNMASTHFRNGDAEQARKNLDRIKEAAPLTPSAADYFYNLGDAAIAMEDWQTAVDALEESLLRNPGDLDAKENYIYAKKMLENQQQQQQNQNQNQDQNQDQNKDQNQDKQDQNQDQNQQQQGQQPKITPQAAQQMLQAIQAKEKETQDKVNKEKAKALNSRQKEKNW